MAADTTRDVKAQPQPVARLVPWLALLPLAAAPLRIVARGYLPGDDLLRHVAKAVSGRDWHDILLLRPEVTMDSHPGWHALLGAVHRATGASPHDLALLSVVGLFLLVTVPPLFLLRRPEAWLGALLLLAVAEPAILTRLLLGRPFLVAEALLIVLCLASAGGRTVRWTWARALACTAAFSLSAWIHPSWHLFLLPVAAIALTGRWRAALGLLGCLGGGVLLAGLYYGHPLTFVQQSVLHTVLAMGVPAPPGTVVFEFAPTDGSPVLVLALAVLLGWRRLAGPWDPAVLRTPVACLAGLGWGLGFSTLRFWSDWGVPAVLALVALEVQACLETRPDGSPRARVALAGALALAVFLSISGNVHGRWNPLVPRWAVLADPAARDALPDPGGILYSDDLGLFFELFYRLPSAPFRYVGGYEAALMPPEDVAILRGIIAARTPQSLEPWVRRMRPQDRLILRSGEGAPPIPGLGWTAVSRTIWSGRVPRPRP